MKTNAERARERLTLTPAAEFTLEKDGFIGALYRPERDEYPGKAVIMFGGSDGIYNLTKLAAEQYVKRVHILIINLFHRQFSLTNYIHIISL